MLNAAKVQPWISMHSERDLNKIGVFSGTFDPVHKGHISLALEAAAQTKLDKVYFMPERNPRRKDSVTHYAHRVAMLKLALRPYRKFEVLELPDKQFSVVQTLPRLKKIFGTAELYQIIGSDMLAIMASAHANEEWPGLETYLQAMTLIVGARSDVDTDSLQNQLNSVQPNGLLYMGESSEVASSAIRLAVARGKTPKELLTSLRPYVKQHWLYASIEDEVANSSL